MSFVFDEVGTFVCCDQFGNELLQFGRGFFATKVLRFESSSIPSRFCLQHDQCAEIRIEVGDQVHRRAFWDQPGADVSVVTR